jgi:nitrous oxide reductase accessory protein NosL
MKRIGGFLALLALLAAFQASAAEKAPPAPSAKDKCAVCGMFVAKYKEWIASAVYKDGAARFFDGPKDMFKYFLMPEVYDPARKRADIAAFHVTDYYTLARIDGRDAYYVLGSDVLGPMGKELVPFLKKADAEAFLNDHGGRNVLRFGEVTRATLKALE